jgi:hypothetical protein
MRCIKIDRSICIAQSLWGFKGMELNLSWNRDFYNYFLFETAWSRRQDHAGFGLMIVIFKFEFDFRIYDSRHWNYEKDRYYLPGEEGRED